MNLNKGYPKILGTDAPASIDDTNATQINEIIADMDIIETDVTANENATALNTIKNTYPAVDAAKLSGIETGATGDQDLSALALKSNVLELDNTDVFTPDADHEPATKKYVDDNVGSGGGGTFELLVAANDATAREKAVADYQCDGTADEVQVNLALAAVKGTGGMVRASTGNFACATAIALKGDSANDVDNPQILFRGSGIDATTFTFSSGVNGLEFTDEPKYDVGFMTLAVAGTSNAIDQQAGNERGNWQSHIHDIFIKTDFSTHGSSSWGIYCESPFRMRFSNIEMNGVYNGMCLTSHTETFNPGNLSVDRIFVDLWNSATNGTGIKISTTSTSSTGHMNLVTFDRVDIAGASTLSNSIGIHLIGATADPGASHYGEVRQCSFRNLNIEDVQTAFKLEAASDNTFLDINYTRVLNGGAVFDLDDESLNNVFENTFLDSSQTGITVDVIKDAGNDSEQPNQFRRTTGWSAGTGTLNATVTDSTRIKDMALSGGSPTIDDDLTKRNNRHKIKAFCVAPFESGTAVSTGNGEVGFTIPTSMDKLNLVNAVASVHTKGTTGTTDVQVRRRRAGTNADMLTTVVTIGDEFYAQDGVINASNDDVTTGDQIYVDVDAVHVTPPDGLSVTLEFK